MKNSLVKNSLYLLTALTVVVASFLLLKWPTMPVLQRMVGLLFIALTCHEWEEFRIPGGLAEMVTSNLNFGRGREALQCVEAQVSASGGEAVGVQADISHIEDSQRVISLAVERFGHVDILVNNAAAFPGSSAMGMTESVWDETFDTDLRGAFFASPRPKR